MHLHCVDVICPHYLPQEKGAYPVPVEKKDAEQSEREEALGNSSPVAAEEMYIPDYVMLNFGLPKEREPAGGHRSDSVD
jgi:hypothetical protein